MKSRFEANSSYSNNWLRLHGYAMGRLGGKRKHISIADYARLPFPECFPEYSSNKGTRFLKRINKKLV